MVTLAHTYRPGKDDVTGWLVQPKLDGCRAIYDGERLLSRTGKEFNAPPWWLEAFRDAYERVGTLDGELIHVGQLEQDADEDGELEATFNDLVSIVRKKEPVDDEWENVIYAVFDTVRDDDMPYSERYELLWGLNNVEGLFVIPIEGIMEEGEVPMEEGWLLEARARGWEGVMLRNPDAPYEHKRTRNLLKVKPVADEEFLVVGAQAGTGKHEGRMGALLCEREGKPFKVGTGFTDDDRQRDDWVGRVITVEYFELTPAGVPRHPRYKAVRDYE